MAETPLSFFDAPAAHEFKRKQKEEWTDTPWHHLRQRLAICFTQRAQVQCQVLDALLTEDQGTHPIGLTQSPFFLHGWSGLYSALKLGRIDRERMQRTLADFLPAHRWANRWIVTALDVTPIPRPCSQTAEDRTLVMWPICRKGQNRCCRGGKCHFSLVCPQRHRALSIRSKQLAFLVRTQRLPSAPSKLVAG